MKSMSATRENDSVSAPVPVPQASAGLGAPVRVRAVHRRQLALDQRLVNRLGCLPDPVINPPRL
jgi:hypothetical protein